MTTLGPSSSVSGNRTVPPAVVCSSNFGAFLLTSDMSVPKRSAFFNYPIGTKAQLIPGS